MLNIHFLVVDEVGDKYISIAMDYYSKVTNMVVN